MQALQLLQELPENFFQLSVGLLEKSFSQVWGLSLFCFSYKFMSEALFYCVVSLVFVLFSLMKKDDDRRDS